MFDFDAISSANGWSQALAGACIVVSGLALLSFIISQLHKFISLLEKKPVATLDTAPEDTGITLPSPFPTDPEALLSFYKSFSASLGDSFQLTDLYKRCGTYQIPHPHMTIKGFMENGLLLPKEEGVFSWR
ncbi:MAG: OadG family protein [Desulfobacteraceae bacterium]|nr:OadG family protein [Desulfobacteraceae bacterium]